MASSGQGHPEGPRARALSGHTKTLDSVLTPAPSRYRICMAMRYLRVVGVLCVLMVGPSAFAEEIGYGPGQVHPDFELPKLDGTLGRLSDYRGKPVILINFASW